MSILLLGRFPSASTWAISPWMPQALAPADCVRTLQAALFAGWGWVRGPRGLSGGMIPLLMCAALPLVAAPGVTPDVPLVDGFPQTPPDKLFPLAEVRRGHRGVGYTVFAADQAERFEVEVLGVLDGMLGPGRSIILARLEGEKIERTGVIAGMSGSPVYIDGRLVGAVAYRFGGFTKDAIAGITPIQDMLDIYGSELEPSADAAPPMFRGALPVSTYRSRGLLEAPPLPPAAVGRGGAATPIVTPLSISGVAPSAFEASRSAFEGAGFLPVATGGASGGPLDLGLFSPRPSDQREVQANRSGEAGRVPAAPIAPASPIAVQLMRGDVNISAIGTVTYVEGDRVLAFGHPFIGHGSAVFPMATASILNTLASEAGSYKQGIAAWEVGAIRQDRLTAIGGDLGAIAPMVPVRILVQRFDEPRASPGLETRVEIVDDPVWFPSMISNAVVSAAARRLGFEVGGTLDLEVRVFVAGDRVLSYRDRLSAPPPLPLPLFAARDVAVTTGLLLRNELQRAPIEGVEVRLLVTKQVELDELLRVEAPARARAGEVITAKVHLRAYRGPTRVVPLSIEVPPDAEGAVELFVGGGVELDQRDGEARGARTPKNLDDLMSLLADRRPAQALYGRIYLPQPGLTRDMSLLTALPPSARATLGAQPRVGLGASAERPGPESKVALPRILTGGQRATIEVYR